MALGRYTLRDVLETYLYTRRWERDQLAEADEHLADQMELQAAIAGVKQPELVSRALRQRAALLREPEFAPESDSRELTAGQQAFMRRGQEAAAAPEPEWAR